MSLFIHTVWQHQLQMLKEEIFDSTMGNVIPPIIDPVMADRTDAALYP